MGETCLGCREVLKDQPRTRTESCLWRRSLGSGWRALGRVLSKTLCQGGVSRKIWKHRGISIFFYPGPGPRFFTQRGEKFLETGLRVGRPAGQQFVPHLMLVIPAQTGSSKGCQGKKRTRPRQDKGSRSLRTTGALVRKPCRPRATPSPIRDPVAGNTATTRACHLQHATHQLSRPHG
ncbi:hypothetical protein VTI74DRAFT_10129 [Chaetomium olivicolor]